ncbi:hypothetical protein Tco_0814000 [Tanacetum coccineum]
MDPMTLSDSEVKTCSKTCLKNHETLKKQYDDLRTEFNKSEFNLANYKRGLASVEGRLVFNKKNEVMFCEQIAVLKKDITYKDFDISVLKCELEKLKKEKESNKLKLDKFENASKSLFALPTIDLSNSGLEEFQQPGFEGYGPKTSKSVCNTPKMGRSGIWVGECYIIDQQHGIRERPLYESFKIDTLD